MQIDYDVLKAKILDVAKQFAARGVGYSQVRQVLNEVANPAGGNMHTRRDLELQQAILTCWHDLFREGTLCWGYDLDNPGPPFFHVAERTSSPNQRRQ